MIEYTNILLPSKPKVIEESNKEGIYEITDLYPGYGHTLGNSLRRMLLSSIPGVAVTKIKINDVPHEFTTLEGIKEDVLTIVLNLKRIRAQINSKEYSPRILKLEKQGKGTITAADFVIPAEVIVTNKDLHIAEMTDDKAKLSIELELEMGIGFATKEENKRHQKEIGVIIPDAYFSPVHRASYEVSNTRVGNRTDFNALRISIQTDGTITPREALEKSIETMIYQFKSLIGFREEVEETPTNEIADPKKIKITDLSLPKGVIASLDVAGIRTIGGLIKKNESEVLKLKGVGDKALQDIKNVLTEVGVMLAE